MSMKSWYSRSNDVELKNGDVRREYNLVFETDSIEIKEIVEKFFQNIMDEKKVNMKYYVMYRRKNHNKFIRYGLSRNNLINTKLDIEIIYRWQDIGNLLDDVVEWRIYDEKDNLCEIGVVESTVKGKEVSWYVGL